MRECVSTGEPIGVRSTFGVSPSLLSILPMSSRVERLLRWVWLINGVLLLGLLAVGLLFVSGQWILDMTAGDEPVSAPARRDEAATPPAPVRYDAPRPIRGTGTRIVLMHRGPGSRSGSALASGSYDARSGAGAIANVGFLSADGARLLLDRPAYISSVRWPGGGAAGDSADARLRWVVYEMAAEDGNGDGRVDHRDARTLYLSDLNGGGLRRVLPEGFVLRSWEVLDDGSLFVGALRGERGRRESDVDRLPARAFVVGADGQARPYAALDSIAEAAGRVRNP